MLVSSLSSTPSKRRSGSGRWATAKSPGGRWSGGGGGGGGGGNSGKRGGRSSGDSGGVSRSGRENAGAEDLSAAHWALIDAERDLEARRLPYARGGDKGRGLLHSEW